MRILGIKLPDVVKICRGCGNPTLVTQQGLCPMCFVLEGEPDDD